MANFWVLLFFLLVRRRCGNGEVPPSTGRTQSVNGKKQGAGAEAQLRRERIIWQGRLTVAAFMEGVTESTALGSKDYRP
ncbi:hypothetical protein [Streptomyces sp. GMR22]|uniref:hypothetical protein n=1 Tax=Streptomyces sp. GMR22 TaxID=2759524 RepID=UPI001F3C557F|nr:hypothetical protein [Streptomyces sp. GMR22]